MSDIPVRLRPLKLQLSLSLAAILCIVTALTFLLQSDRFGRTKLQQSVDSNIDLHEQLHLLNTLIALPLTLNNTADATAVLSVIAQTDKHLLRVKVIDKNEKIFLDWRSPIALPQSPLVALQATVRYRNDTAGKLETLWIAPSKQSADEVTAIHSIAVTVLPLSLLALAAYLLMLSLIVNPVRKLLALSHTLDMAPKNFQPAAIFNTSEFKTIADRLLTLGTTRKALQDAQFKLTGMEYAMRSLNERFSLILNAAGNGVFILDRTGAVNFVNDTALDILGWNKQECIGRCLNELIRHRILNGSPVSLSNETIDAFSHPFTDGKKHEVDGEIFWHKTGQPVAVKYISTPIFEKGELTGAVIIFENINLRLEAEQKLKDSEALKQAMLESSLAAIVTIDDEGKIYEYNNNAEGLFGFKKSDVLFKEMAELLIPARYRDAHRQGMKRYLQSGEHRILGKRIEITGLKESGEEFPIELVVSPINLHNKLLFTAFINDMTEKNRAKTAIENARIAAENANKAKSQFLAAMSHEIRTPLNAIIGVNELLQTTELDPEQMEYVNVAHQAGISLQEVINNILDYSKVEAGKMEFHLQKTDIVAVVDSVLSIMGPRASEKKLDLFATVDYPIPDKTLIDPARLRQILLNLVSNAIKFTDKGSVEIRIGMKKNTLGSAALLFSVTDTGIGVSDDAKNLIFEEFTQADLSTTRKYGGTGLGLAIASRLVSVFGGEIGAESVEGKGSTFWFSVIPANKDLISPAVYETIHCYVFNSVQKSTFALYKNLNALCAEVKFISSTDEIATHDGLSIVFVDERQLPFYSSTEIESLRSLNRTDLVKVLITGIRIKPYEQSRIKDFDTYLIRPLQIKQLNEFLKNCIESYNRGHKIRRRTTKTERFQVAPGNGCHILVVEDSINNQRVIKAMLEKSNYEIDIADNGHEALEKTKLNTYDMILMDLSMPVMGGMETTEYLRKTEGPNQKTPIIALTASAYEDKKDDCIQIGMNGFLAKPLNMASLHKEIARLLKPKTALKPLPATAGRTEVTTAADKVSVIDYAVIEQLKADTSEQLLPEFIDLFLSQSEIRVALIEQALATGDFPLFAGEIHSLKSESATYGAVKLGELTADINALCRKNEKEPAFRAAQPLRDIWLAAADELKRFRSTLDHS